MSRLKNLPGDFLQSLVQGLGNKIPAMGKTSLSSELVEICPVGMSEVRIKG